MSHELLEGFDYTQIASGRTRNGLYVAAMRGAGVLEPQPDASYELVRSAGGVQTAFASVAENPEMKFSWQAWPGAKGPQSPEDPQVPQAREALRKSSLEMGIEQVPVFLNAEEIRKHYLGYSNEVIWWLFHEMPQACNFEKAADYWPVYRSVNEKYADLIKQNSKADDVIWVQDYQFLLVGKQLKEKEVKQKVGFFLHIPFPPVETFNQLPDKEQKEEILKGLLAYDVVSFQADTYKENFFTDGKNNASRSRNRRKCTRN